MSPLNVLVTWSIDDESMASIAEAAPGATVTRVPYIEEEHRRDLRRKGKLQELAENPTLISPKLQVALADADVVYGLDYPVGLVDMAPKLKWVQMIGAGVDHLQGTGLMESDLTVTAMGGFSSRSIAEYVISQMLNHVKHMKRYIEEVARQRTWTRLPMDTLMGKTLGIIGLGRIGSDTALLAKPFGMRILASKRTPSSELPANVDQLYPADALREMLPQCDFVVLSVALTPETTRMIGEAELRLMKKDAFLINVARGAVVDEEALIRALKEGWIAGAVLDVFEHEPLPPESPLWDMPNVLVTPHASAAVARYAYHAAQFFARNLRRYVAGEPLENIVDKSKGY